MEAMVQLDIYDLIVTEAWWDRSCNWNTVIEGYKLFRRDSQGRRRQGVDLYGREKIDCKTMPQRNRHRQVESLWVNI